MLPLRRLSTRVVFRPELLLQLAYQRDADDHRYQVGRVLKDAGLVSDRKEGRWVHYSLNKDAFAEIQSVVGELKPSARRLVVREDGCC